MNLPIPDQCRASYPRTYLSILTQIREYSEVSEIGAIVDRWIEKQFPLKAANARRGGRGGRGDSRGSRDRDRSGRNRADKDGGSGGRDKSEGEGGKEPEGGED